MRRCLAVLFVAVLCAPAVHASSYVMMADEDLVDSAGLIVRARIASVQVQTAGRTLATEYLLSGADWLKGRAAEPLRVRVPGGRVPGGVSLRVDGIPSLEEGQEVILFLARRDDGRWAPVQLMLGMFRVTSTGSGHVAHRDLTEAVSVQLDRPARRLDPSLSMAHLPRDADGFASWIRERAAGVQRQPDYFLTADATPLVAPFTLFEVGGRNLHWSEFAGAGDTVTWHMHRKGQRGLLQRGANAFQASLAAWSKAVRGVTFVFGGKRRARSGFTSSDGINAILFNDPNDDIGGSFNCTTGGVLAIGGPWFNSSVLDGQFIRILEGDIVVQDGIRCALGRVSGAARGALAEANAAELFGHELGHTLGLNHSCGDTASGPCNAVRKDDALMRAVAHFDGRGARIVRDDKAAARALRYNR